jgi:Domain of unknown function (DUF4783)
MLPMIKKKRSLIVYTAFLLLIFSTTFAQQKFLNYDNKSESKEQDNVTLSVFNNIELGISSENVSEISGYLNTPTYLSLSNGISGYYSSNQAFYVLEDFFNIYKVTSFHFQNIQLHDNLPYATGVYKYYFRGKRDSANVYVSLKQVGDTWKITQITIN